MEDINLHFTGDFAAIEKSQQPARGADRQQHLPPEGCLGIDPRTVKWKRVLN